LPVLLIAGGVLQAVLVEGDGPGTVRNITQCCARIVQEATNLCLEFGQFGFNMDSCSPWQLFAKESCEQHFGNCTKIADVLRDQCVFQLRAASNNKKEVLDLCLLTHRSMQNFRCPIACHVDIQDCFGDEADRCMEHCGVYAPCHCRMRHGTALPDECMGETVLNAPDPQRAFQNYSCEFMPAECRHHWDAPKLEGNNGTCGKYRNCESNMCIIKDVKCVATNPCRDIGFCEPREGLCWFSNRPYGHPCNDSLFYTVNDICDDGSCAGTTDYCLKYNVTCHSMSPCLSGGVCHPHNGRCTYTEALDGTQCDDHRVYTVDDSCMGGLCVGRVMDLCAEGGVVCPEQVCHDPGVCDGKTGTCGLPLPVGNERVCSDGDDVTIGDMCLDGLCVGDLNGKSQTVKFKTLGKGECSDREGRRMARYSGDVEDEDECERTCREDQQCRAYAFAFPVCNIYGTVRTRAPQGSEWSFQLGTAPPALVIERAWPASMGQRVGICRRKGDEGDVEQSWPSEEIDEDKIFGPLGVAAFGLGFLLLFFCRPICKCLRVSLWGVAEDDRGGLMVQRTFVRSAPKPPPSPASSEDGKLRALGKVADHDPALGDVATPREADPPFANDCAGSATIVRATPPPLADAKPPTVEPPMVEPVAAEPAAEPADGPPSMPPAAT